MTKSAATREIELDPAPEIPGVRPAEQARSRALQEKFVVAGQRMLLRERLHDIAIPALAKEAKSSVGGFYSRFESKDAFFEFMLRRMLEENGSLYAAALAQARDGGAGRAAISAALVDHMIRVFSGPWRGALREAYASIPETRETWMPIRSRGEAVRQDVASLLGVDPGAEGPARDRVAFAVQLLFGMLNNSLMSPDLAFPIDHPTFRTLLIETFDALVAPAAAQETTDNQEERGSTAPDPGGDTP